MNVTRKNIDDLNAVLTVAVYKSDYTYKVEKMLKEYQKQTELPGFRKGTVPMSTIEKKYGRPLFLDMVNKTIQEDLTKYLQQEKLDLLGNPLPVKNDNINWDAEKIEFDFEIALAPTFDIDLGSIKDLTQYKISADDKMLEDQVARIQKQYGKMIAKDTFEKGNDVSGTFRNEEKAIDAPAQFSLEIFKDEKAVEALFLGKKVGDVVTLNTKGLFEDDHQLMDYLKVSHDDVHGLDINVDFTIEEITESEPAELNQELFDKLFGEGNVSSVEEIKEKIKEDAEKQFETQSNQKFLNDVTEALLKSTKFDLPSEFLKRWIQTVGETPLTPEQAEEEFAKSENGLRYQLIEGRVMSQNNLQLNFQDLKAYTAEMIKKQMAQFGQMNPTDADVDGIVTRVLSNQEEAKRISDQVMSEKMLNLYKEKVSSSVKEVTYQEFIAASYGE
ncbi:trigger factor [Flavobacterium arsenatis]|uniref:Trigger factor n=1 Tax=Flavobacterium arsenatis TaxID=1484332 RepID=A0ABU1TKN4_9FLAO|nr:trigger factor [Flavobacterium arsenatis]MDR6966539.1 trigger factor [Flavobacterium arsenatis]